MAELIAPGSGPLEVLDGLARLDRVADERGAAMRLETAGRMRAGAVVALASVVAQHSSDGSTPASWKRLGDPAQKQFESFGRGVHLARLSDLASARELADRVSSGLAGKAAAPSPSVLRMARFVFEELGANVVQHSGRPDTGFGTITFDEASRRLELACADRGVGFLRSLQRNPELEGRIADDAEALQLAVTARISGSGPSRSNMGIGLKLLVDLSDWIGGELWIASGAAVLYRRTVAGARANAVRPVGPWRGAWICLVADV